MAHTHPNSIFRWEDSASLEHACWHCPTKANSPHALQTCYGIHSIPCTAYHQTMHAVGAAHRCTGCAATREIHNARHREIAELVAEYKNTEDMTLKRTILGERNTNAAGLRQERPTPLRFIRLPDDNNNDGDAGQRDDHATAGDENDENDDIISPTSSQTSPSVTDSPTPSRRPSKAEIRVQKKAKKAAKSQHKALKNQSQHHGTNITTADVEHIATILHGSSETENTAHPLATDKTAEDVIARTLSHVQANQAHKHDLVQSVLQGGKEIKQQQHRQKTKRHEETTGSGSHRPYKLIIELDEVVSAIMAKLAIDPTHIHASLVGTSNNTSSTNTEPSKSLSNSTPSCTTRRKRTSTCSAFSPVIPVSSAVSSKRHVWLASRLRAAITKDLETQENELQQMCVRAAGFWRYVGRQVFVRMTEMEL